MRLEATKSGEMPILWALIQLMTYKFIVPYEGLQRGRQFNGTHYELAWIV